jgi:hypothetical protein
MTSTMITRHFELKILQKVSDMQYFKLKILQKVGYLSACNRIAAYK